MNYNSNKRAGDPCVGHSRLGDEPVGFVFRQNRERFAERIGNVADKVEQCDVQMTHGSGASVSGYVVSDPSSNKPKEESALSKTTHGRQVGTEFFLCVVETLARS